ncbi:MAG TPA: DoxX family protein [Oligoflexus sp.]|uniref:DoxX family protein n=1 Tax=Oligoflexus sp. TaxID=1971216 RepID=UPI002D2C925B|nr:DoxX family protein [Oligoflexus sp.]HYX37207.1 DoxX family protein [Oligoflexus sp.]
MRSKIGWVLSVLPSLLLLFSGFNKIMATEEVLAGLTHFGIDPAHIKGLGVLEIMITLLYLIPRTSFIGAILLTGWMGGAIFTHVRVGDPYFMQVAVAFLIWIGFGLRHYSEVLPLLGMRKPTR